MVHYAPADLISVSDFAYAWRITDERWDRLPPAQLERLLPLSTTRGEELTQVARTFRFTRALHVNTREYHAVSECAARVDDAPEVKHWLTTLPLSPQEAVYVCWSEGTALITNWATFTQVWDSLWYLDALAVFDDTQNWAVLFGPEEYAVFLQPGAVDPQAAAYDFAAGYCLVRHLFTPPPAS